MFGHPALFARHPARDPQRETFFPEQCVAAVARANAPDQFFFRKMDDVAPVRIQVAQGMKSRNEIRGVAEPVQRNFAHARHHSHAGDNVRAVGEFNSDAALWRRRGSQDIRDDVHRPALHRTREQTAQLFFGFSRRHPVVGRTGVFFFPRADEGDFFRARHVRRIAPVQETIRIGFRVQRQRMALANQLLLDAGVFFLGPVTPDSLIGAGHAGNRLHPLLQGRRHKTSKRHYRGMLAGERRE